MQIHHAKTEDPRRDGGEQGNDNREPKTGQPKPPSRLESLARAREAQLQDAERLRAKFQDAQTADGDRGAPPQSERAEGDEPSRKPRPQSLRHHPAAPTATKAANRQSNPQQISCDPAGGQTPGEGNKPQPGPEVSQPAEKAAPHSEETGENLAPPEAQGDQGGDPSKDAGADDTGEDAAGEAAATEAVEAEATELRSVSHGELADGEA